MSDRGQTLYDRLELRADASAAEIEQSYRGMLAYLGAGSMAMYSMMEEDEIANLRLQVQEAYDTLKDPERRAAYDRSLARGSEGYPSLMIPASPTDTHVTVGHVMARTIDTTAAALPPRVMPEPTVARPPVESTPSPARVASAVSVVPVAPVVPATPVTSVAPVASAVPAIQVTPFVPVAEPAPVAVASIRSQLVTAPVPAVPASEEPASELPVAIEKVAALPFGGTPALTPRPWTPPPVHASPRVVRRLAPKPDAPITPETEFTGAYLRRLRESANASLDDMCEITKVGKRYLRAIEDGDFEALPAAVYVRGFVVEYARALALDPSQVAKSFMGLYKRFKGEGG